MTAHLQYGFATRYRASLDNHMIENEFVHVFFGRTAATPMPNSDEVSEVEWVTISQLSSAILAEPEKYAAWLRHYFQNCYGQLEDHLSSVH